MPTPVGLCEVRHSAASAWAKIIASDNEAFGIFERILHPAQESVFLGWLHRETVDANLAGVAQDICIGPLGRQHNRQVRARATRRIAQAGKKVNSADLPHADVDQGDIGMEGG